MGLFGFGKKKNQQPEQITSPAPEPEVNLPTMSDAADLFLKRLNDPQYQSENVPKTYSESIDSFLARNDDAKQVTLSGKQEDLAFYDVGNRCQVEEDDDADEKYNVLCGGSVIGRLPASAISYAEKHDCPPEDLAVIISDVDYDLEKQRDIITVYVSY